MNEIAFLLNGAPVTAAGADPTRTLLDWLREDRRLTGTKEGCNEGDCGACTVMVRDPERDRWQTLNACITFLPQLHGRAVRTVEGIAGPDGALHPVQRAMIDHHGSQCGFCTPGVVVSLAAAHANRETDFDDRLAGNLCRCTGYAPIVRAAEAAHGAPVPDWLEEDFGQLGTIAPRPGPAAFRPESADALAAWYLDHPEAVLVAGATDVGLWVTKGLRRLSPVAFIAGIAELRGIDIGTERVRIGAAATVAELATAIAPLHPDLAGLLRRYGSVQVRNAATVGGNIANASPIGDLPPALIALGATLHLRRGDARREIPLEAFFVAYGKQDRAPGEFVEAVSFPRQPDRLRVYKLSKRFDQDISAVCGAFNIVVQDGAVSRARIAFGGMAEVPKRARAVEAALVGQPWTEAAVTAAADAFAEDFRPISDMRASAAYRLEAARNMLRRCWLGDAGAAARVLEVRP